MRVFRRSHRDSAPYEEDRECLLEECREVKEQEESPVYDLGSELDLEHEDYVRMAAAWESRCRQLERTVKQMMMMYKIPLPIDPKQKQEQKKLLEAMYMMKNYILKLENENEMLSDALAGMGQIERRLDEDVPHEDVPLSHENLQETKESQTTLSIQTQPQKQGADWKVVEIIARKLAEAKRETSQLNYSLVLKDRDMESLISQVEELLYENERLTTKCESLQDAASTLVNEVERSNQVIFNEKRQAAIIISQEVVQSLTTIVESEEIDICKSDDSGEVGLILYPKHLVVEKVNKAAQERGAEPTPPSKDEEVASPQSIDNTTLNVQGGKETSPQDEAISLDMDKESENITQLKELIAETVLDNSDDEISTGQPEDSDKIHVEHVDSDAGAGDKVSDGGEERDELAPLGSNPLESVRDDVSSGANRKFGSSASNFSEMQRYLQDVVQQRNEKDEDAHSATMTAIQMYHADRDKEVQINPNASRKAQDSRLEVLKSMSKHGRWRNKLFARLHPSKEVPRKRGVLATKTKGGVWC